jgi:hypothetical protein
MAAVTKTNPVEQGKVPRLDNGDRLTREEFERRYDADPSIKKAELIEGVVYMASPVRFHGHGNEHFNLIAWLASYVTVTPGVEGGDNSSLRLDLDNEPQPDAKLIIRPEPGGQAQIDEEGHIVGAPELVAEVSGSSVSYDLHVKFKVYRRSGVKEYVVWRVDDQAIDWFVLRAGKFEPLAALEEIYRSEVFPGLWLDPAALIAGNLPKVVATVQQGPPPQSIKRLSTNCKSPR